jgi:hypothetical protein
MILFLLWLDMAYTRLMGTAGVVEMDKVEVSLPCEAVLFEAPTTASFLKAANHGAQITMPRMHMQNAHAAVQSTLNHISVQTLLGALYLQSAAARHRLLAGNRTLLEAYSFTPAEAFAVDRKAKDIMTTLVLLPSMHANVLQSRNTVTALAWNNLCIVLTADLDLLEVASGREGMESTRAALVHIATWSRSASARRAVLHAAQIFYILSSSRVPESYISRPDLLLFISALVLSLYLFVSSGEEDSYHLPALELLQEIDWTAVEGEGLMNSLEIYRSGPFSDRQLRSNSSNAARNFIRYGGLVSFAGEPQQGGGVAARKILLNYAHLLDDFGKWNGSRYSQLLRTMSNFMIEGSQ